MSRVRIQDDEFSAGVCCALAVIGRALEEAYYDEIVETCDERLLLSYAKRTKDPEYDRIAASVKRLKRKRRSEAALEKSNHSAEPEAREG